MTLAQQAAEYADNSSLERGQRPVSELNMAAVWFVSGTRPVCLIRDESGWVHVTFPDGSVGVYSDESLIRAMEREDV